MDYQKLLHDCKKQKPKAQKELYDHFADQMMGVCFRYTKSITDAEDALQEGFIKVFENIHQYRGEGELGGWIKKVIVNNCINYLRKNKNYCRDLVFTEEYLHPISNDPSPEVLISTKQIANLIRQLPNGFQVIFNLHAIEGYSHVEIGQLLGINASTSRSQYARARSLLMSWMENISNEFNKSNYAK